MMTATQQTNTATTRSPRMHASIQTEYGEPDQVLRMSTSDIPTPGEGQVLVKVRAAGVDRGVWHLVTGLPLPVRLAGFGVRRPKNPTPGLDVAGTVVALGAGVTEFAVDNEVFGVGVGTFAEYAVCRVDKIVRRSASITPIAAAVTAISGLTALQAVRDHGRVSAGQKVLVIGASGGVGSFAVQIATAFGAEVTALSSTAKMTAVGSLGASRVLGYENGLPDGIRYDVVIDTGGNTPLRTVMRSLTPRGTLVIVGGETGGRMLGGTDRQLRALAVGPFMKQRLVSFLSSENAADIAVLARMIESGAVTPLVDRSFDLAHAGDAIRYLADGKATGKVVVTVS